MNKPIAIVLGGTAPHIALIENLQKRGYHTILVDFYENPPAAAAADRHIKESTLDIEKVLEIARQEKAALVISGCVDQANATACYVAEKFDLPAPYSYETALRVTDKALMKEGMRNGSIPTAPHLVVSLATIDSLNESKYPMVVKPADCNGSKGVQKVNDYDELKEAIAAACSFSRSGKAIVESFNEGQEVNGYFFIGEDNVFELYVKSKKLPWNRGKASLQSFISLGPAKITDPARENFKTAVKKIATEFSLKNTPILVQANVMGDSVKVIEFAPRVGGGLAFREIALLTGFDMIDAVISSYLGEPVDASNVIEVTEKISIVHLYGTSGIFQCVEGMETLLSKGIVDEFHLHKTPGMEMSSSDLASRNRVLGAIIRGKTTEELEQKVETMVKELQIISTEGKDVLDRSLFA